VASGQHNEPVPPNERGKRWTITDVAQRAGVSVGTASKALNGRGNLRAETRSRVLKAAENLGFEPNALARSLLAGRSFTVGLVTTDSFGRFSIPVMLGAEDALGEGSVSVFLCDCRDDPERERRYLCTLLSRPVDGIIVAARRVDPRPPIGSQLPVPVVYAVAQSLDRQDLSVLPNDARPGGAKPTLCCWTGNPLLTPYFVGATRSHAGVADALHESGRRIPDDVALVGYDNWDVMAQACRPPLTTVDPNLSEVGRVAARDLLAAIEGQGPGGVRTVACSLVVRESTTGTTNAPSPAPQPLTAPETRPRT
jgi:LacI family transcriptional regulator